MNDWDGDGFDDWDLYDAVAQQLGALLTANEIRELLKEQSNGTT